MPDHGVYFDGRVAHAHARAYLDSAAHLYAVSSIRHSFTPEPTRATPTANATAIIQAFSASNDRVISVTLNP